MGYNDGGYRIGIDLGGTNIKVGIVDSDCNIIDTYSVKTLVGRPYQEIIKDMGDAVLHLLQKTGLTADDCYALGVGSPGCIDFERGQVAFAGNLFWENVPLINELKKYIDLPMAISNDANCAALGEALAGAAKGCGSALMITLGTGVGGGVVINGSIFEGGNAGGAELGHIVIVAGGESCTCGRNGCFEAYSSATALIREAKKAAVSNPDSLINELCGNDVDSINGEIPFEAAKRGDPAAKAVIDSYIKHLGDGIVNLANIFRPDIVLISGGVCNQGENLTNPLNAYVKKYIFAGDKAFVPEVKRAALGNAAGIIGAAFLVKD